MHLLIEVKGYRYLDANAKKSTMETYWIPGVNKLKTYGRWAFIELNKDHFEGIYIPAYGDHLSGNSETRDCRI